MVKVRGKTAKLSNDTVQAAAFALLRCTTISMSDDEDDEPIEEEVEGDENGEENGEGEEGASPELPAVVLPPEPEIKLQPDQYVIAEFACPEAGGKYCFQLGQRALVHGGANGTICLWDLQVCCDTCVISLKSRRLKDAHIRRRLAELG